MKRLWLQIGGMVLLVVMLASARIGSTAPPVVPSGDRQLAIRNVVAEGGVYDPSVVDDGSGRLWMSYSTVRPSRSHGMLLHQVSVRAAYSDDGGQDWLDAGAIAESTEQPLPGRFAKLSAVWENEVSRLAFNPYAAKSEQWKILYHRYLRVQDGKMPDSAPLFEHGWIELKSAPSPKGPWSSPRKLFTGIAYNKDNDNTIGKPEMALHRSFPAPEKLGNCAAFTEPGILVRQNATYVVMKCAGGKKESQIMLLACDHDLRKCEYAGAFLRDRDARAMGSYSSFSAPDLIENKGQIYLAVSPTTDPGEAYRGCMFFPVESLGEAKLKLRDGRPEPALFLAGPAGSISGACGYVAASKSGILISRFFAQSAPHFRIFATGQAPP